MGFVEPRNIMVKEKIKASHRSRKYVLLYSNSMVHIQVSLKISMASAIHRIGWGHVVHVPCYPTGIYRYFIWSRKRAVEIQLFQTILHIYQQKA